MQAGRDSLVQVYNLLVHLQFVTFMSSSNKLFICNCMLLCQKQIRKTSKSKIKNFRWPCLSSYVRKLDSGPFFGGFVVLFGWPDVMFFLTRR
jgi:hypothetical protein